MLKSNKDTIQVWTKDCKAEQKIKLIGEDIEKILNLNQESSKLEYKGFFEK